MLSEINRCRKWLVTAENSHGLFEKAYPITVTT